MIVFRKPQNSLPGGSAGVMAALRNQSKDGRRVSCSACYFHSKENDKSASTTA